MNKQVMAGGDVETGNKSHGSVPGIGQHLLAKLTAPKPIGFFLFLLIVVTTVPALAVSIVLLQRNDVAQREVVHTLAEAMAGSIAEAIDRELSGMMTTLRVLSTTPSLSAGAYEDFYNRAKSALVGSRSHLIVADENLDQILNTRVPFRTALGPIAAPDAAQHALDNREMTISGVFMGETTREWVFEVILPFFPEDQPPRLLILRRNAASIADTLSQQMLRGGWNASLVDREGRVIASSFMSSNVGNPFFLDLSAPSPQTAQLSENTAPETFLAILDESHLSGWNVAVWAPTTVIEQPMVRTLWQLLAGSLIVIALGAVLAWFLGRRIAKPVRHLAIDARRLGAGEPIESISYPIAEVATVSAALAEASADRRAAENEIRLLMREVAHRAKNQLTVVASMAKQTARGAHSLPTFLDSFQKRLHGLARSTDLLIEGGSSGVDLYQLLVAQIEPFRPEDQKRLELSGPPFRLANQAAQTIGLAAHELATNAAKYGAFVTNTGRLVISWNIEQDLLVLVWREYGAQVPRKTSKRGFGTEIIERMLGGTLSADMTRTFHEDGLEYVFRIPVERIIPERASTALPL